MGTFYYYNEDTKTFSTTAPEKKEKARSASIIQDSMEATWHPCTGKLMDSKSQFRKITKAHGCIEVGNEKMVDKTHQQIETNVRDELIRSFG